MIPKIPGQGWVMAAFKYNAVVLMTGVELCCCPDRFFFKGATILKCNSFLYLFEPERPQPEGIIAWQFCSHSRTFTNCIQNKDFSYSWSRLRILLVIDQYRELLNRIWALMYWTLWPCFQETELWVRSIVFQRLLFRLKWVIRYSLGKRHLLIAFLF